ncbi:hypothetical protein [Jiangella rhizosphaerae]|uniref:ABC transporter permease n=1 Tax=Jiangella rhizosphaerae TaxID=2293569 RepID=A0A418KPF8_9ACTN|nr:hypothetical protein [Jiangella rhizosphaerae]RIQ20924.1 hypothetical protein DY240_16350 [Jiangella rhizosphaerae]
MSDPTPSPLPAWRQLAIVVTGLTVLLVVLLSAFALPPLHSGPHDLPVAIAGDGDDGLAAELDGQGYAVTEAADTDAARALLLDRAAYGAIVLDATGRPDELLVATAASNAVATRLRALGAELGVETVTDVRPFPADDPSGAGLSAGALPLALGGWIAAVVLLMTVRGPGRQAAGAAAFAVVAGLALTALLRFGFGTFDGAYWATAGAAALGISATAWTILGLRTALGNAGLAVGAVVLILLGNPLSGLASAPELLPAGWGALGQLLPPGATGSLLRSAAYFDGAGAAEPLLVLTFWLAGGVALFALGVRRAQRVAEAVPA